ncbi:hypothetical protein [Fluviicola taffensis]|uniref:hypothetical protein n=1 Tax=Fluviicola taffensis TaxID=191579 RepID=UPI003137A7C3
MKLNYEWKRIAERGQSSIGYVDVFQLIGNHRAIVIIHYLPQYEDTQQRIMFTLILEGNKSNWTDGMINRIFEDAEKRIFNVEFDKFNNLNTLEYMDTQIFTIKCIDDFEYLNHGDLKINSTF